MSPSSCAITEIGIVLVTRDGARSQVSEWSSLLNPMRPIPPEIQFLTGISNAMVANAPSFADLAPTIAEQLHGAVFVAHHARFDYGFIKQAFADIGISFTEKTLCTVRLSKLLDPDRAPHSLDALIHRHRLGESDRHRALGDARLIYRYVHKMYEQRGAAIIEPAIRRLLKQPSLPAHLPANALTDVPNTPGVYQFLGVNDQPLYIGKSIHLRERVASHFVNDHRSERGVRLASEIRRIDWQETVGDFGAQLLEQVLIRTLQPSHNSALRRKQNQIVLMPFSGSHKQAQTRAQTPIQTPIQTPAQKPSPKPLQWRRIHDILPNELPGHFGPFASPASAKHWLIEQAPNAGICLAVLGIQRVTAGGPCFNRQLNRCQGCCIADEPIDRMLERLTELLAPLRIPGWPYPDGLVCIESTAPSKVGQSAPAETDERRSDWHVFDQWCYLGSTRSESQAFELLSRAERTFDADTYRLLQRALARVPGAACEWNLRFRTPDLETPGADR